MVHLSTIPDRTAASSKDGAVTPNTKAKLQLSEFSDDLTLNVYGSKYANESLPKDEMPESSVPRDVAYRMIKDDLSLDGNPRLK
jgi:glutamate decarboxylase